MYKSLFIGLILIFAAIIPINAAVLLVPDDYSTIQEAINYSNNGDTIVVSPGTYYENISYLGKNVTVTSTDPEDWDVVASTIIDGNSVDRVVAFMNSETSNAVLTGFTITGGVNQEGAGIYCYYSSPTISRNIIMNNHGQIDFTDGLYTSYGAGIYCYRSDAIITRNIIKENTAYYGGGIRSYYNEPFISNNIITENRAVYGGGLYIRYGGFVYNNTIVSNNCSYDTGTGTSSAYGDNLYFRYYSQSYDYEMEICNNIIAYGKTRYGIYFYEDVPGSLKFSNNNTWDNQGGNYYDAYYGQTLDLTGINGNISADPCFIDDDYHISTGSPCYNAGDIAYTPYMWQRDIDGEYAVMGASVDIGADEVQGNPRPVASAGDDQLYKIIPTSISLNGTGSYDPCNESLVYEWEQTGGESVVLIDSNSSTPSFSPLVKDVYYFQLRVFDGSNYSNPDTVMIVVGNRIPVANAGSDRYCQPFEQISISGSGSYDLDEDDILTYNWTQISGTPVVLSNNNVQSPSLMLTEVGEYVFQLIVSDGEDSSQPDTVKVICNIGSAPDAYGYNWIDSDNPYGPAYYWEDISNARHHITDIEGGPGRVLGSITMSFDFNFYGKTYKKIYVQSSGVLSFGPDPIYYYDPIPYQDGYDNMIAWMWTEMELTKDSVVHYKEFNKEKMVIQFENWTTYGGYGKVDAQVIIYKSGRILIQYKKYEAENYYYSYTIGIENRDGTIGSEVAYGEYDYIHDELAIEFSTGGPYIPVAHAGPNQEHKIVEQITLDGSGSVDRDPNDVLTYQWTQVSGTTVTLSDPTSSIATFMPPSEGEYIFELVVNDGTYTSYPDQVRVYIGNQIPIAEAGDGKAVKPGQQVSLNASGSYDPDSGDSIVNYFWTQISGPSVSLSSSTTSRYAYFTPTAIGEYVFQLVVSDGVSTSQPDTVTILCSYGSYPDNYGYSWIDSDTSYGPVYEWIDIQKTGTKIYHPNNTSQASIGPVPLGFNFDFYGNTYNSFYIQASGAITFDSQVLTTDNKRFPVADSYNNMIAWFWSYHYLDSDSEIYYQNFDGYTVVQFVDYDMQSSSETVNAEVILYESGKIILQYKDFSVNSYIYQHTIGIENEDGTDGLQISYNTSSYPYNELAIEISFGSPYEPIAEAGDNQYIRTLEQVTLDASNSLGRDPSGIINYQWSQVEGLPVTLNNSTSAYPTFTPSADGAYKFQLIVSNSVHTGTPDYVYVFVGNENPIADAGPDMIVKVPSTVILDGTFSHDYDLNDVLSYVWFQTEGPMVALQNAGTANPSFYCDQEGLYKFMLYVNDGLDISSPDMVVVKTAQSKSGQQVIDLGYGISDYFYYPSFSGDKLVYSYGTESDYSWDIYYDNLTTGSLYSFAAGGIDTQPKIDGDIVVWFGGMNFNDPWSNEPRNSSVIARNLSTGVQRTLKGYSMSSSYSHPVVSGKKVVWIEHQNLNTTPIGSNNAANWWNSTYSICGADVSSMSYPNYFTVASNVGTRDPYPVDNFASDFDDVIDIDNDIVVYEANGDIYGADISDLGNIRVFTICSNPFRQFDPAISGNIVVWTDQRNDLGDIYGADISDIDNIRSFIVVKAQGTQEQPDIDGRYMVYVDGDNGNGNIKASFIAGQSALDIPLTGTLYGSAPVIEGQMIIWQTSTHEQLEALSIEFLYTTIDGPVENTTSGKKYDYIQHAIDDSNDGDTIVVEPGVYCENIDTHGKNLVIHSSDSDDSSIVESTILKALDNDIAVVTYSDGQDVNCVLEGFTITESKIGIYCEEFSSPTISKCNIVDNSMYGIYLYRGCEPLITECKIMNNGDTGIKMSTTYEDYNKPVITNCVICGNVIVGISGGQPEIINCTISDNSLCGLYNCHAAISNTIIYFNGNQVIGAVESINYSNLPGTWSGMGNINSDPLFADSQNGDYHLQSEASRWSEVSQSWIQDTSSSPCIDAGDPSSSVGEEPAPNGSIINIGAYGGTSQASMSN